MWGSFSQKVVLNNRAQCYMNLFRELHGQDGVFGWFEVASVFFFAGNLLLLRWLESQRLIVDVLAFLWG